MKKNSRNSKPGIHYFPQWKNQNIEAGVTTKNFSSTFQKTDDLNSLVNQKKLNAALEGGLFVYLNQVHGAKVAVIKKTDGLHPKDFLRFEETDGAITNVPGLKILVMTADCLSVFLRAPGWVGVVHAGWRGTEKKITETAVKLMLKNSGCKPSEIHAILGPSICHRHYEVGQEFEKYFTKPALTKKGKRYFFDLALENKRQVRLLDVPSKNIVDSKFCTISGNKKFYSFRLEKESAGRMISFIRLGS